MVQLLPDCDCTEFGQLKPFYYRWLHSTLLQWLAANRLSQENLLRLAWALHRRGALHSVGLCTVKPSVGRKLMHCSNRPSNTGQMEVHSLCPSPAFPLACPTSGGAAGGAKWVMEDCRTNILHCEVNLRQHKVRIQPRGSWAMISALLFP